MRVSLAAAFAFAAAMGCASAPTAPPDRDGDAMPDAADGCPDQPEDRDGFEDYDGCLDPDNDSDGIADVVDLGTCRNEPEDYDGYQDEDGCPDNDNDGDGIFDGNDGLREADGLGSCRNAPEDRDNFQDDDGCPDPDNDGDGLADVDDPRPFDRNNEVPPCPSTYFPDPIPFALGSDEIAPGRAASTLEMMVYALRSHPNQLTRVTVVGHYGRGESKGLALRRAQSVVTYFVTRGVASRLFEVKDGGLAPATRDAKTPQELARQRFVAFPSVEPTPFCCGTR